MTLSIEFLLGVVVGFLWLALAEIADAYIRRRRHRRAMVRYFDGEPIPSVTEYQRMYWNMIKVEKARLREARRALGQRQ